jgi:hyperosmotically inducible periplasmic protein
MLAVMERRDKLIGALPEKYAWAKRDGENGENQVSRRLREIDEQTRPARVPFRNRSEGRGLVRPNSTQDRGVTHVRQLLRSVLVLMLLVAVTAGCTAMTGKSAGTNVDDAKITAIVKEKLAVEKISTLTKIDVDTNKGTVYLTGNVTSEDLKTKATQIAWQVAGVNGVVNNLKVQ